MRTDEELARHVLEVIPLVMRAVGAEMRRATAGLSVPHYRLLALLCQGPRTVSELAACQAVALPTISRTVSTLVERGWVTRSTDSRDRRRVVIAASEEGRAVFADLHARAEAEVARRMTSLSPREREHLWVGLEVLHAIFAHEVELSNTPADWAHRYADRISRR